MNSDAQYRYVGRQRYQNETSFAFFSDDNVSLLKNKIETLLLKYRMNGQIIQVSKNTIVNVMNQIYENKHGRLHEMNDDVIEIVYDAISNECEQIEYNNSLDKMAAFHQHPETLTQRHPPIKLKTKTLNHGFNMNY